MWLSLCYLAGKLHILVGKTSMSLQPSTICVQFVPSRMALWFHIVFFTFFPWSMLCSCGDEGA